MRIHIARNVFDVMANLESAVQNERNARELGQAWISDKFQSSLEANLLELRQASADHSRSSQGLTVAQRERRAQMTVLIRLVRDFYVVLRRRSQRDQTLALEALYGRPARLPHSAPVIQWLEWANQIVKGEQQARAQGYPAMINPSATDIQRVLSKASDCQTQWSSYQQSIKAQEQRLRQARSQGTRALRGLAMRLREALAHEAAPTRREIMRTFGFSFHSTGAKDRRHTSSEPSILTQMQLTPRPQSEAPKVNLTKPSTELQPEGREAAQALLRQNRTSQEPMGHEVKITKESNTQAETTWPEADKPNSIGEARLHQTQSSNQSVPADKGVHAVGKAKKLSRREKKAARRALAKQAA